uniref:Adenylylsulfate kinase, putative n=1 Tax=Arundo donax TaxID=35708 RepID=A0A0A9F2V5_ARUDO
MDTQESDQYSHICTKLANICSPQGDIGLALPLLWVKGIPHLSS